MPGSGSTPLEQNQTGLGLASTQNELENSSSSVELDDIIEDFDGRSESLASFSNRKLSQSYFTATNGNKDDDTTSFYSALPDGFSLNQYGFDSASKFPTGSECLWTNNDYSERDKMLPSVDFQVYWHDLIYRIEPKINLTNLWYDLEQYFKNGTNAINRLIGCGRRTNYEPNQKTYNQEPLTIIQQISGSFKSGELTGIIGPSGAGKTSLLNFLSRRREDGYTGQLYINNSNRRIKISTIPQNDHLPEYLTVRENLMFASRLKNPHPHYDHDRNIENVSNLLGFKHCLDVRTKKISGGELKRLAIGQELLSKPDILILDEPTSGLDSLTCYRTVSVLKDLTQASARKLIDPIAIVLTIHQPQQEVFDIFDKIYVMASGGTVIYNGPPDSCSQFVEKYAGIQKPDGDYNPASFLIDIASGEHGSGPIKALENQVKLEFSKNREKLASQSLNKAAQSQTNAQRKAMKRSISLDPESVDRIDDVPTWNGARRKLYLYIDQRIAKGSSMNKGSFFLKTRILAERYGISILRDPKQLIARLIFHVMFPIGLAFMMGKEPGRANACPKFSSQYQLKDLVEDSSLTSSDVQEEFLLTLENIALLFVMIYSLTSANVAAITLSFTLDMQSSLKEFYNGWYSMPSYIIARFITDIPMSLCLPVITLAIGYPLSGQMTGQGMSDAYRILITALGIILGSMVAQMIGMIFGAIYIGHVSTALFASQGASLPFVFLSGFVVRTKSMSKLIYAISQLSFYRHTLELAIVARYGFGVCNCTTGTISGRDAELVGVPDRLKSFTQYWLSSFGEQTSDVEDRTIGPANSTRAISSDMDIFQMFAKQISLYNTYGVDIKSCKDVKPYQLYDLSLDDQDVPRAFVALIILLIITKLLLFLTVKLVTHFRTSL